MWMYLEIQGEEIWDVVENGHCIPTTVINEVEQVKVKGSWNKYDKKKVLFHKMEKNILAYALGMDEYFLILNCKTTK